MSSQMPPSGAEMENPYAAPLAHVSDAEIIGQAVLADRATRLGAFLLDNLVVLGPMFAAFFYIGVNAGMRKVSLAEASNSLTYLFVLVGLIFVAVSIVNLIFLYNSGQTIAKRWLGIKIVRTDGSRCSLPRILFLRGLPLGFLTGLLNRLAPSLGYLVTLVDGLMIFRDDRRCLHDLIADTKVVKV